MRVYREDVRTVRPFADEALKLFWFIADWQRQQLCQFLATRPAPPRTVMQFTRRWRKDVSESNLTTASLAFHTALVDAWHTEVLTEKEWVAARQEIAQEATAYGPTHEALRQAAWVGMCVTEEWSVLDGLVETIGEPRPVGDPLSSPYSRARHDLAVQIAAHWPQLREHFGDTLLSRLSGLDASWTAAGWNELALVAGSSAPLEAELEDALAADPALLAQEGVLAWFATRPGTSPDVVVDALLRHLPASSNVRGVAVRLLADAERLGLTSDLVVPRLEEMLGTAGGMGRRGAGDAGRVGTGSPTGDGSLGRVQPRRQGLVCGTLNRRRATHTVERRAAPTDVLRRGVRRRPRLAGRPDAPRTRWPLTPAIPSSSRTSSAAWPGASAGTRSG